jgi:Ca-activated chloride channel family protein
MDTETPKLIFLYPYLLIAVPVLLTAGLTLYLLSRRSRRRKISQFTTFEETDEMLRSKDEHRRQLRHALVILGLCLLAVGLARPMTGPKKGAANRDGIDVLLAVDVSKSMLAGDMKPYRLEAVRQSIHGWVDKLAGDRVGLIFFAGDAFLQIPLTNDLVSVGKLLDAAGPKIIRAGGSNMEKGLQTAIDAYKRDKGSSRAVVIFSDGENLEGDPLKLAGEAYREHKIRVFTVGVGTAEGAIVPQFYDPKKQKLEGNVRNEYGAPVRSRINPIELRNIAQAGGGAYYDLADDPKALEKLHEVHLTKLAKETRSINADDYDDWFQIPVALGLFLLFLEPLLQNFKAVKQPQRQPKSKSSRVKPMQPAPKLASARTTAAIALAGLGGLSLILGAPEASAANQKSLEVRGDQQQISSGQAAKALENLKKRMEAAPDDAEARYNYGVGLYAVGKYAEAGAVFEEVANMPGTELRDKALFQLANAGVRVGEGMVKKNEYAAGTAELERALGVYDQLEKEDKRADKNIAAAEVTYLELLERLADSAMKGANESKNYQQERPNLERAIGALDKMLDRQPEHKNAQKKLEVAKDRLAKNLLKEAQEKRAAAEKMAEANKEITEEKKKQDPFKPMQEAVDIAQQAVNTDPDNKEANEFLADTQKKFSDMLTESAKKNLENALADKKPQNAENKLEKAMAQAQQAVDMNKDNQEAKEVLEQAKAEAEKNAMQQADNMAEAAERAKDATQEALALNQAIEKYQDVLDINEENKRAENMLKNLQPKLADALTQMAKDELAKAEKAAGQKAPQQPGQQQPGQQQPGAPKEPSVAEMRQSMEHLSKADQALAQATQLGQNQQQTQPVQEQVNALTDQMQKQLDQALAQAEAMGDQQTPPQEGMEGQPQPGQPQQPGQPKGPVQKKEKTFADIRNVTSGGKDGFVKDW